MGADLHFDASNWRSPQPLLVRGVDDDVRDGEQPYTVSVYARFAAQAAADGLLIERIAFVNRDDDVATLARLGDLPGGDVASYVEGLSQSGDTVVGYARNADGDMATRFTLEDGLEALGGPGSRAHGISADQQLITGSVTDDTVEGRGRRAVLWHGPSNYQPLAGPIADDGTPIIWPVEGYGVSDEGVVYGECVQYGAYGEPLSCSIDGVAPNYLELLGGGHIYVVDAVGNVAGDRYPGRGAPGPFPARYNGASLPFPSDADCAPIVGCRAEARAFSRDGATVVGIATLPPPGVNLPGAPLLTVAFKFTSEEGMVRLVDLPGGMDSSAAYAVTDDARIIGGHGEDYTGQTAVLWIDSLPQRLDHTFTAHGGVVPAGFQFTDVRAVSPDGRVLAGNGRSADGSPEGYRIVLADQL